MQRGCHATMPTNNPAKLISVIPNACILNFTFFYKAFAPFSGMYWKIALNCPERTKNCEELRTSARQKPRIILSHVLCWWPQPQDPGIIKPVLRLYQNNSSSCFPPLSQILTHKIHGYLQKPCKTWATLHEQHQTLEKAADTTQGESHAKFCVFRSLQPCVA